MAGVHVQGMARHRPGADVEDDGEALTADDVEHFLHQDQSLARGEVRHPTPCKRVAFRGGRAGVLRLGLDEDQRGVPQVALAVGYRLTVTDTHRRRGGDGVGAGALSDVRLDVNDVARTVGDGRDSGVACGHRNTSGPFGAGHAPNAPL